MAPKFPADIYTQRETENLPGIVYDATKKQNLYSEDIQNLGGEINAIETILGVNPQGSYATTKEYIDAINVGLANLLSVISIVSGKVGICTSTPVSLFSIGSSSQFQVDAFGNVTSASLNLLSIGLGHASIISNIAIGLNALSGTSLSGTLNTAVGSNALAVNSSGTGNTAIGGIALSHNTTGSSNSAFGYGSLTANTTGASNLGVGAGSLFANTTGGNNTAIGGASLYSNTTGVNSVGVGVCSLYNNTTGGNNLGIGYQSLFSNTTGNYNTCIGINTLYCNTTGNGNVAIGYGAGAWSTLSNALFVSNVLQSSLANDKAYSLLYGTFSGVAGSLTGQQLTINGKLNVNGLPSGTLLAPPVGLNVGDFWLDTTTSSQYPILRQRAS